MSRTNELIEKVERLKSMLVARATGSAGDDGEYFRLRAELLRDPRLKDRLPRCVKTCRNLDEFWGFIKPKFAHYAERREFLREEFDPLLATLEAAGTAVTDTSVDEALLRVVDWDHVQAAWRRAQERRTVDPEGAITAARTMLEAVCKHILDERHVAYDARADLPPLYATVAKSLNLAPDQHGEQVFKQVLGGCATAVNGFASLRNMWSDAHGRAKASVRPKARHAELAVNLAGTLASFLIATHTERPPTPTAQPRP